MIELLAFALLAVQEDVVTPVDGPPVAGQVTKDNLTGVTVKPKTGPVKDFKPEQVARVEYRDAPPPFREGLQRIEAGRFSDGLAKFREADAWVKTVKEDQTKPLGRRTYGDAKPPGKWFDAYNLFYKAECQRNNKDYLGAYDGYMALIEGQKDFRLIRKCYEGAMRALIDRADPKADDARALLAKAQGAVGQLGDPFVKELKGVLTDLYIKMGDWQEAVKAFEEMEQSSDDAVHLAGIKGKLGILLKTESKDLVSYAEKLAKSDRLSAGRFLGASMLGRYWMEQATKSSRSDDYRKAVAALVDAMVVHFPGVGRGVDDEHEDALFNLAGCYEKLAGIYEKSGNKDGQRMYMIEAAGAYRELVAAHPTSDRVMEADAKAGELEEKLPATEAKNP